MTKRIFRAICLVTLAAVIGVVGVTMAILYHCFSVNEQQQLKNQTILAAQAVELQGAEYFENLRLSHCRITWVAEDGTVWYDNQTDASLLENHLEREEIKEAIASGYGESVRYSDTQLMRSLYAAIRLQDGSILRLSITQDTVLRLLGDIMRPILMILSLTMILAFVIASRLAKRIVKPLNDMDLDHPLVNEEYVEISPLLHRLEMQKRKLHLQANELEQRQQEFRLITESLNEGLILLNETGNILSMNRAAQRWLSVGPDYAGKKLIEIHSEPELQKLLKRALDGKRREAFLELSDGYYQLDASPVVSDDVVTGAVILMFDITEKGQAEQLRREFTANVSHELKTPLHSISGYAELLANGMVREQDIPQFSGKIYTEAQRMIQLVEDIMKLSHLDESQDELTREPLELYQLTADTLQNFYGQAEKHHIRLQLKGSAAMIRGIPRLISVMISNLCDNAIKYNREGGSVTVLVYLEGKYAVLSVKDDGIGISQEYQERIFERFYRVDKSHSKEVGGTGLGLSIVKHAAKLHHARLDVQSTVGQGTVVTVRFPR